jgi:four helix bundle protein
MAKLEKFEDLMAWQKARELSQALSRVTREGGWSKDRRLTEQIQGAPVAVMTYVADSFGRWETNEALGLLSDALTAAMDIRTCLCIAFDAGYIDGKTFDDLRRQAEDLSRAVGAWRGGVAKRRNRSSDNRSSGNGSGYHNDRRDDQHEESRQDDRRPAYQGR